MIGAFSAKTIADLDIGYRIKDRFTLSIGASNRFDMVRVNMAVTTERVKWKAVVDLLTPPRTESQANFLFFDAGRPQAAKALATEGVLVGRTFAPYVTWLRITICFPGENARA